jgi:hypothetical protein
MITRTIVGIIDSTPLVEGTHYYQLGKLVTCRGSGFQPRSFLQPDGADRG